MKGKIELYNISFLILKVELHFNTYVAFNNPSTISQILPYLSFVQIVRTCVHQDANELT